MDDLMFMVDANDEVIGEVSKFEGHKATWVTSDQGQIHRAFSLIVVNSRDDSILLQKRSRNKLINPLMWTNALCSHPLK
jgi:isopentenyl-diphosphate delta-isomerase